MQIEHQSLEKAKEKMEKTLGSLKKEFSHIRAGRANPQLLDGIMVNYYGTPTPITQVGNLSVPEPRMLTLSLWDASMLKEVEKAIMASELGIMPSDDGKVIRLGFPEPTAERRAELVKVARKKSEDAKVAIRSLRRDALEQLKKDKKSSLITEDDLKDLEKEMQTMTDKYIKLIGDLTADKEKEITEI